MVFHLTHIDFRKDTSGKSLKSRNSVTSYKHMVAVFPKHIACERQIVEKCKVNTNVGLSSYLPSDVRVTDTEIRYVIAITYTERRHIVDSVLTRIPVSASSYNAYIVKEKESTAPDIVISDLTPRSTNLEVGDSCSERSPELLIANHPTCGNRGEETEALFR